MPLLLEVGEEVDEEEVEEEEEEEVVPFKDYRKKQTEIEKRKKNREKRKKNPATEKRKKKITIRRVNRRRQEIRCERQKIQKIKKRKMEGGFCEEIVVASVKGRWLSQ